MLLYADFSRGARISGGCDACFGPAGFNELMAVTLQQYVLANLMLFSCLYYIYNGYINHIGDICFMN